MKLKHWMIAVILLVVTAIGLGIAMYIFHRQPHEYFLQHPESVEEGTAMLDELNAGILANAELDDQDQTHSAYNDSDRLYPYDRLIIVSLIQRYYLTNGRLAESTDQLQSAFPEEFAEIQWTYKIDIVQTRAHQEYILPTGIDVVVARGN